MPGTMPAMAILGNTLAKTVAGLDWVGIGRDLDAQGYALTGPLLSSATCQSLAALYDQPAHFRSRIVMSRHRFGSGEYQYFGYPLPDCVETLRQAVYPRLAGVANEWMAKLSQSVVYPAGLDEFLTQCHHDGQVRPTPLLLRYKTGDYNRLHQDLYGELYFPLQMAVLLSEPEEDFSGGEFMLVEQRPRQQSRGEVVPLGLGEGVIFGVNYRPVQGTRGAYRATLRHGVSTIRQGERFCLGVIFHDAT